MRTPGITVLFRQRFWLNQNVVEQHSVVIGTPGLWSYNDYWLCVSSTSHHHQDHLLSPFLHTSGYCLFQIYHWDIWISPTIHLHLVFSVEFYFLRLTFLSHRIMCSLQYCMLKKLIFSNIVFCITMYCYVLFVLLNVMFCSLTEKLYPHCSIPCGPKKRIRAWIKHTTSFHIANELWQISINKTKSRLNERGMKTALLISKYSFYSRYVAFLYVYIE